jgi:hypothetical protein
LFCPINHAGKESAANANCSLKPAVTDFQLILAFALRNRGSNDVQGWVFNNLTGIATLLLSQGNYSPSH